MKKAELLPLKADPFTLTDANAKIFVTKIFRLSGQHHIFHNHRPIVLDILVQYICMNGSVNGMCLLSLIHFCSIH